MKDYFVYIVKCSDNSYYTGITNNLQSRMHQHNTGIDPTCYTFNKRPVELMFSERFDDIKQAITIEKRIKGWSRKKKEALIARDFDKLKELSKNTLRQSQGDTSSD